MGILIIFLNFVIGLCFGSFLNVLIDRWPRGLQVIKGRSYCDSCKKPLQFFDLIPVLSFIFLSGRCRNCQKTISFYYPLVEILTGSLLVLVFNNSNLFLTNIISFFILSFCLVIFFTDLKYGVIPDQAIIIGTVFSFLLLILFTPYLLIPNTLTAIASFIFFWLLNYLTKGKGMGLGDAKLALVLGLFLGWPMIIACLYIAFLTGAITAVILILGGKKRFGQTIPFGPFLVVSLYICFFWQNEISGWIQNII